MADNSRDSRRRRRILHQGSDRLALITGRIQSLPNTPQPDADADAPSSSQSQPLISSDPNSTFATLLPRGDAVQELDSTLLNHDSHVNNPYHSDASKSITQTQPQAETESEISSLLTPEFEHEHEHVQVQPPPPDSSDISMQQPQHEALAKQPKHLIIPSEISSAINASRVTRLCCSVAVALLVVASYLGFSLLGTKFIKTLISFRPLYLVLATNLTVVIARVLSGKQRGSERSDRRQNKASSDGNQWDIATTLELGLVMQTVVDALFMDCAVYAIIVICGLSLVQA